MKKTTVKKFGTAMLASMFALGMFSGCSDTNNQKVYHIGICQLVQHQALDAATQGFQDKFKELVGGDDHVQFDYQNAQNESANCATICNQFVASGYDLIMANATPALQSAATSTTDIPILGTSITDYGTALDISDFSGTTGRNVSGTADLAPLDEQAKMVQELFPDAKNIGILYCSAEANSKYQSTKVTEALTAMGYTVKEFTFSDSNDVSAVTTNACDESDVLYIPTDNTAASNAELINNIALPAKTPIVAGEEAICKGCGVATLSISYYDLGVKTGEMAYNVLVKGEDVSSMQIEYAPATTKEYMADRASELGVTIPDGYTAIAE